MLTHKLKIFFQDHTYIFQDTYLETSQTHQLTVMHGFEHKNHDVILNLLFQNFYKLFFRACNLHQ